MRIINKENQTTVGQISPQGTLACMGACAIVCAITQFVATHMGIIFLSY